MKFLSTYFEFGRHNTSFKTEIIAGLTTFVTIAYIIVVNPKILEVAGMLILGAMSLAFYVFYPY